MYQNHKHIQLKTTHTAKGCALRTFKSSAVRAMRPSMHAWAICVRYAVTGGGAV